MLSVRALELGCRSFERRPEDFVMTSAPVHMARTEIAEAAMERGYDFVLMHDDDTVLGIQGGVSPLDAFHDVFDSDPKVAVVGALYMRSSPIMPMVCVAHPRCPEELVQVVNGIPAGPFECAAMGTGFMMVRVSALRELSEKEDAEGDPPLFRFPIARTRWGVLAETGEDYDFCKRVRALGYKVVADPRWDTVHLKERGRLVWNHADWERAWETPGSAPERELRANIDPALRFETVNGFQVLDHVPLREAAARQWRARQKKVAA